MALLVEKVFSLLPADICPYCSEIGHGAREMFVAAAGYLRNSRLNRIPRAHMGRAAWTEVGRLLGAAPSRLTKPRQRWYLHCRGEGLTDKA